MKVVYRLRKAIFALTFFFRTREINCKIYMQNRIPCVELTASLWQYLFVEFLIFSAFIGFENLHNVLIAYEDKTKLIIFYTHLSDTISYMFFLKTFKCTSNIIFVGFCLTIMSKFFSRQTEATVLHPWEGLLQFLLTIMLKKFSLQTDPNVRP